MATGLDHTFFRFFLRSPGNAGNLKECVYKGRLTWYTEHMNVNTNQAALAAVLESQDVTPRPTAWPVIDTNIMTVIEVHPTWQSASSAWTRNSGPLVIIDHRGGQWTLDPDNRTWHPSGFEFEMVVEDTEEFET